MKFGLVLPAFRDDPAPALAMAVEAESAGLDGVFVMDHLWPMNQPGRPALAAFPLLAAVAASTEGVALGPLVARVGLVPDAVLVNQFAGLALVAGPERVIAGLGTGDRLSREENQLYGIEYAPAADRLAALAAVTERLMAAGLEVWVGGRSQAIRDLASRSGATLNVWGADVDTFSAEAGELTGRSPATWAGQVLLGADAADAARRAEARSDTATLLAGDVASVADSLQAYGEAGATWVVAAPVSTDDVDVVTRLATVVDRLRRPTGGA